jgi:phytoene synthase
MDAKTFNSGFKQARALTQKYARTFYLASLFLPKEQREASYAVYALCRLSDEAVDGSTLADDKALRLLEGKISQAYSSGRLNDPLLAAFSLTVNKYAVPQEYFRQLLEGMRQDLTQKRYEDFNRLYGYCYKAAGVVGLIMLRIFGAKSQDAESFAIKLGVAMQLTNIIRDIKEDYGRGRIYLPQDEISKYGVSEEDIAGGLVNANFKELLRAQIERARFYYREAEPGFKLISGKRSALVAMAMSRMYSRILDQVERNGYDVFSRRAIVPGAEKLIIAAGTILKRR